MTLALFDLDNTLLEGDSDHGFGEFLIEQGLVDETAFKAANDKFYADYVAGTLDIIAYSEFALAPIMTMSHAEQLALRERFLNEKVESMILSKGESLLKEHTEKGHTLIIITATNRFVTSPIAERLGVKHLLATEPEVINGQYTGKIIGTPCFQAGKVKRLKTWIEENQESLKGSYFYSDSANDIPLLNEVDHPIAVDPCERLKRYAIAHNMPIISLRQ